MSEEKCCCSKEPLGSIPIMRIFDRLDMLFDKKDMAEAGRLLEYWEKEARALNDRRGLLEILSEQVGYYRSMEDKEKGLRAVEEALSILDCTDDGDSVANATIYLNCATTMKAFDKTAEAIPYYEKAKEVYERLLPNDDVRLAGFYNNYATALDDLGRDAETKETYYKAVDILKRIGGCSELAVTYVNLALSAHSEESIGDEEKEKEIEELLMLAYDCLNDEKLARDGNYARTCEKCATVFGFFGYFLNKQELERRAKEIYEANGN